jgi:hypothetical protein
MNQDSVPGKSSFGHKFSNFWFKVETGIDAAGHAIRLPVVSIAAIKSNEVFYP